MSQLLQQAYTLLRPQVAQQQATAVLPELVRRFPDAVTLSTSFSYEDQVITHLVAGYPVSVFTLDTGRLFRSTYATWQATNEYFGIKIKAFYPEQDALEAFLTEQGPDSFYQSPALRKQCCLLRKVLPLKRALKGQSVWITGLRAAHAAGRESLEPLEWDEDNQIIKYHPLLYWTDEEVKQYVHRHRLPYNVLHDQGYASIGCEPCTRPVRPGEDFRSGRWWWETGHSKECGLHVPDHLIIQKS